MHYRLGTVSLAATTLLVSLTSPLFPLGRFEPLVVQAQTTEDRKAEADRLFQTGVEQFNKGQLREALATFQQMRALSRDSGDQLGEAEAKSGIGEVYLFSLKPTTEAIAVLQEALAIYQGIKDTPEIQFRRSQGQARTLTLTGLAYSQLNQKDKALKYMQKALLIQRLVKDKEGEGKTLNYMASLNIADYTVTDPNQLIQALETLQQALAINREVGNSSNQIVSLGLLGWGHNRLGDNAQALKFLNEALTKSREKGYRLWEGQALVLMSIVYSSQGDTKQALAPAQQALSISETIGSKGTSDALSLLGAIYQSQQQYSEALKFYQQALTIARQLKDRATEDNILNQIKSVGVALNGIGVSYSNQKQYEQALTYYQQALAIHREVKNHSAEITTLNNIGFDYKTQKQYSQAREYFEQALAIAKQTENRTAEAQSFLNISYIYHSRGHELLEANSIQQALEAFQQALKFSQSAMLIAQNLPDDERKKAALGIATAYSGTTHAYDAQKNYPEAIAATHQTINFAQQAGNQRLAFSALGVLVSRHANLGMEFTTAGKFQQASAVLQQGLEYGQQRLTLAQNDEQKRDALEGIWVIYTTIGNLDAKQEQYPKAIEAVKQALAITRQLGNRALEAITLGAIAGYHSSLDQYRQALERNQQSLAIFRELGKPLQEIMALGGIGKAYSDLGQYSKAREYYQQALAIAKQQRATLMEALILNNIGIIDAAQGEYVRALEHYQQALQINGEVRRRLPTEAPNNLGRLCYSGASEDNETSSSAYLVEQTIEHERKNCLEVARSIEAKTLNNIGYVYHGQGRYLEAIENYQQSLTIAKELKDRGSEAMGLTNIGAVYLSQGEYSKALESFQKSLEINIAIGDRSTERTSLNNIGQVYSNWGRYTQALEFHQKSLAIAKEIGTRSGEATTLSNIGTIYGDQGNYRQSMEYQQQALAIYREIGDRYGEMNSLNNIGYIHSAQGRYPQALEFYQNSLAIAKEIGARSEEATALSNVGAVYNDQGNISLSMQYYQQALAIHQEIGNRSSEALSLNNIGVSYGSQGEYAKALELHQKALKITQEIGARVEEVQSLSNIGGLYKTLGQYSQALEYSQKALAITKEIGNRDQQMGILNGIGNTYRQQERYTEALETYRQGLTIAQEIGNRSQEGYSLTNLGYVYERQGNLSQALASLQQAVTIFRDIGEPSGESLALRGLGRVYAASNQNAEALKSYQQAIAIQRQLGYRPYEGLTLSYLGNLYNSTGQYADAEKSLFEAVAILESVRGSKLTDEHKISLFDTQADTYRYLQQALIAQNKTNAALEVAERGRARAFVELLAKQLSPQSNEPIKHPSLEEITQIAQQQNATLVEYSLVPGQSLYIWVIQPNGKIDFRSVDLKTWLQEQNTSLADLVSNTRESIGVSRSIFSAEVVNPVNENNPTKRLQQLHQLLIKPIADLLPTDSSQRVIFNPQGELFLVPFAAIQDEQGKYLIEKHTILTAPAIQVLQLTQEQRQQVRARHAVPLQGNNALVVGNPTMPSVPPKDGEKPQQLPNLPGAKREAEAIAPLLNTKALTGNEATKAAVLAKLPQAKIIHLATHGLFDDLRGLGSAIALAPDSPSSVAKGEQQGGNGLLTAEEILKLKLNAELVVLSACDTGRGRITGDGVIGLSRSLIAAGTPSVIVSLWAVPDNPTEELMTEFYRQLKQTGDKAQALRTAMLKLKEKYPDSPRKWAAFTLIGEAQ